jgi:hypothetical protein
MYFGLVSSEKDRVREGIPGGQRSTTGAYRYIREQRRSLGRVYWVLTDHEVNRPGGHYCGA